MGSKIPWTDFTWNPCTGCTKISIGCKNCYAEPMHKRLMAMGQKKYQQPFDKVCIHPETLDEPLKRKKPAMYFVNSMSDLFHEDVPFTFIEQVWDTMLDAPQHIFQILTKRPFRMKAFIEWMNSNRLRATDYDNIWLGVSAEDQKNWNSRVPILIDIPAKVKFVSIEPMLGEIDINDIPDGRDPELYPLDWIVLGGESGIDRRLFKVKWAEIVLKDCREMGVQFFMKQIDGVLPIPEHLKIREYPK